MLRLGEEGLEGTLNLVHAQNPCMRSDHKCDSAEEPSISMNERWRATRNASLPVQCCPKSVDSPALYSPTVLWVPRAAADVEVAGAQRCPERGPSDRRRGAHHLAQLRRAAEGGVRGALRGALLRQQRLQCLARARPHRSVRGVPPQRCGRWNCRCRKYPVFIVRPQWG